MQQYAGFPVGVSTRSTVLSYLGISELERIGVPQIVIIRPQGRDPRTEHLAGRRAAGRPGSSETADRDAAGGRRAGEGARQDRYGKERPLIRRPANKEDSTTCVSHLFPHCSYCAGGHLHAASSCAGSTAEQGIHDRSAVGKQQLLSSYRGKVVMMAFMFTTCPHCQALSKVITSCRANWGRAVSKPSVRCSTTKSTRPIPRQRPGDGRLP